MSRLVLVILVWSLAVTAWAKEPVQFVIFLSDDHGQRDSQPYGSKDAKTPQMQALADRGCRFTRAFVATPSCAPSRAALLTGLMPARNGAEANHSFKRDDVASLPDQLRKLGYETAAFGKVAHGKTDVERHGFDHHDLRHDVAVVREYLAGRKTDKPLCLFVGTHSPHVPWPENQGYDPKEMHLLPTDVDTPATRDFRTRYLTDVSQADLELGQIYDLAKDKLGENVFFLYTSDHGAQWPFGKWNLYDAGIRVPFIIEWPGVIPPGSTCDAMVSWIDILPTLIELAGGTPPDDIDGKSFAKLLNNGTVTKESLSQAHHRDRIFTTHSGDGPWNVYPIRSVRTERYQYIRNLHPEFQFTTHIDKARGRDGLIIWHSWLRAAENDPHAAKMVQRYYQRPAEELYDLQNDPFEMDNLADDPAYAQTLSELRGELDQWMQQQGDRQHVFNEPLLIGPNGPKPVKPVPPGRRKKQSGKK